MRRHRATIAVAATLALAGFALTGCTSATPSPTPSASASVPADPALKPKFPTDFTAATAQAETVRVADAIVGLLPASIVLHVDNTAQLVPATTDAGAYYGVLRHVTLDPTVDPVAIATTVAEKLVASGWSQLQSSDTSGVHIITLSSGSLAKTSWFLIVSGDPRVEGQSVVSVQLASPDLP